MLAEIFITHETVGFNTKCYPFTYCHVTITSLKQLKWKENLDTIQIHLFDISLKIQCMQN